jgi:hypothetical protein
METNRFPLRNLGFFGCGWLYAPFTARSHQQAPDNASDVISKACEKRPLSEVQLAVLLHEKGMEATDGRQQTALFYAVKNDDEPLASWLLENGADVREIFDISDPLSQMLATKIQKPLYLV